MTKIERNEMIIKMSKLNKTQNEIANEIGCSIRTVQRVLSDTMTTIEKSNLDKIGQNEFCITAEMWESLQDRIDSLLDTMEIQSAKIQSLKAILRGENHD